LKKINILTQSISQLESTSSEEISLDHLSELMNGSKDQMIRMTTVFLDQIENHFSELKKALDDNDLDSIKDITHKMKSSFRLFGLHKTGILLERIEQKAKSLDRQDLENKLQSLLNMQPRLTALVQKELNQLILLNS
jgi:HPt (histidine-containing phosphotransfer) domain-containing protein